jgi:hypothetical protein
MHGSPPPTPRESRFETVRSLQRSPGDPRQECLRAPNVCRLTCGEAPSASGASGAPLAATNQSVGGRDLQAA